MLAERVRKNVRELEGVLNRVVAYADLTQSRITPELASRAMGRTGVAGLERVTPPSRRCFTPFRATSK